jgi:FMN phosphatase YigB (HAD superfamily)
MSSENVEKRADLDCSTRTVGFVRSRLKKRAKSVRQIRALLWKRLDSYDVFSFDVFDTLLHRRIHPPEAIKNLAAKHLVGLLKQQRVSSDADTVLHHRAEVEEGLRRATAQGGGDGECRLRDLIHALLQRYKPDLEAGIGDDIASSAIEQEFQLELQVSYADAAMRQLVVDLLKLGKRVILCSDMYMSSEQIAFLLEENGYPVAQLPLYVSSDHNMCKGSGRLFRLWLQLEKVEPRRAIHIGDNPHSDYEVPWREGLDAIWYRDSREIRRQTWLAELASLAGRHDYWKGGYVLEACRLSRHAPPRPDFFYQYGRDFLGPLGAVFAHKVLERVQEYAIDHVMFIAREGFIYRKVYEILAPALLKEMRRPTTSYACLSRYNTAVASVRRFSPREIEIGATRKSPRRGLRSVLKSYGLPHEPFETIAREFGIEPQEVISQRQEARFGRFLTDPRVQKAAHEHRLVAAESLQRYLSQCGFFGNGRRVAIVDVGWNGSIQSNLICAFGEREDFPHLFGFYLGRAGGAFDQLRFTPSFEEGLLRDYRRRDVTERALMEFVEILENGARAPHGTTVGYARREENHVSPVFKACGTPDREAEVNFNPKLAALQQGAVDFAEAYAETIAWTGYTSTQVKPYALMQAGRFLCLPRAEEARRILDDLNHSLDGGEDDVVDLGIADFSVFRRADWRAAYSCRWKQGVVVQASRALAWATSLAKFLSWNE